MDWIDSKRRHWGSALAFGFLLVGIPWLVSVQERPLVPVDGYTYPRSILATSRDSLYFSTDLSEEPFYRELAQLVSAQPMVQKLGLVFDKPFLEYPVWAMTKNLEGNTTISYRWATGASQKYLIQDEDVDFLLTDRCENPNTFPGFSLVLMSEQDKCLYAEISNP